MHLYPDRLIEIICDIISINTLIGGSLNTRNIFFFLRNFSKNNRVKFCHTGVKGNGDTIPCLFRIPTEQIKLL